MHIGFDNANFAELAALWNRFFPAKYGVGPDLIRQNSVESPVFDWGASVIYKLGEAVLGFVVMKRSGTPTLYRGYDPDQWHLSALAFSEPEVGVDMLAYAKSVICDRGATKLVFGQDSSHFFPGCPMDCPNLRDFLMVEGFTEHQGNCFDLEHDMADYTPKPGCLERLTGNVCVRPVAQSEKGQLEQFLLKEFPGRWHHDVMFKISAEERTDMVYGLFEGSTLQGFAFTQDWTHRRPVNGCVWNADLGPNWGGLGPIGMAADMRGRGLGDTLLAGALVGLKEKGVRRMIIDWTGLDRYYGGHGFQITRRYTGFDLVFESA